MAYPEFSEVLAGAVSKLGAIETWSEPQLKELARTKLELERIKRNNPLLFYKPYDSRLVAGRKPQEEFHKSRAKIRLFVAGNRAGKSEAGIIEDVYWATGLNPYRTIKPPTYGWIVSLDFPTSRDVAEDKVRRWLPPGMIKSWDNQDRVITLTNGSTIGFRSCDQDINKFGGKALHWVHFDEEPSGERGYQIYKECLMRTADYQGSLWFTMTPVSGMSWSYDELYEAAVFDKDIFVLTADSRENPHVPLRELEKIGEKLTKDEYDMRMKGHYVQFSGLVYKEFNKNKHIVPAFAIPRDVKKYRTIDHGLNAPTACLWLFVNSRDEYYVYDEYYETDKTIPDNCASIKQITAGDRIEWTTIDPATEQRDANDKITYRQRYRDNGIPTRALKSDKMLGIDAIKHLLIDNPATARPRLFIFESCRNLIREFTRYRWKKHIGEDAKQHVDEVVKSYDHCITGDTLIDTVDGRIQIKDLVGKEGKVNCFNEVNQEKTVSDFYNVRLTQKNVDVYKVTTTDGREIKATAEHLVLTKEGWKQVCSLTISDEIVDILEIKILFKQL